MLEAQWLSTYTIKMNPPPPQCTKTDFISKLAPIYFLRFEIKDVAESEFIIWIFKTVFAALTFIRENEYMYKLLIDSLDC